MTSTIEIEAGLKMFGGGATGRLHPGSIEYSMANQSGQYFLTAPSRIWFKIFEAAPFYLTDPDFSGEF